MAMMAGLHPPLIESCRFLDVGCADALNVIAVAYAWPNCQCVGLDLSESAIREGQRLVDRLELKNVRLVAADLCHPPDLGEFDYIAAHGVYSWVSAPVRDAAMALCARLLSADGIAYFGYDVLPGGFLKAMTRELMRWQIGHERRDFHDLQRARAGLEAIQAASHPPEWAGLLRTQVDRLQAIPDVLLFHDDLNPVYEPVWFDAFAQHASQHGLIFVSEADPLDVFLPKLSPQGSALIDQLGGDDPIRRERAADTIRGRSFRQSLLARDRHAARLTAPSPATMSKVHIVSKLRAEPAPDPRGAVTFRYGPEGRVTVIDPTAAATLGVLADAAPRAIPFGSLCELASNRTGTPNDPGHSMKVMEVVKGVAGAGFAQLHAAPIRSAISLLDAGARPRASRLARIQVAEGKPATTLQGLRAQIRGDAGGQLLSLLDGQRTLAEIVVAMQSHAAAVGAHVTESEIRAQVASLIDLGLIHPGQ